MSVAWTEAPRFEAHTTLQPYLQDLKTRYRDSRLAWWEIYLGLYSDQQDVAVLSSRASSPSSPLMATDSVPLNITAPIVDTGEAQIAGSTRPRPYFKAVGGSYSHKRKCQRLQKAIDGIFDEVDAYRVGSAMVKDAGIFGTSACKIHIRDSKIRVDRVLISEILVDENLAFTGTPNELTHAPEVSKATLLRSFKSAAAKKAINALTTVGYSSDWSELVEVYETWSLPRGGKPGRRVITIPGATLLDEEWEHDYFPIVFFRWAEMPTGFYGQGLIQQVMGIQLEMTRWFRNISRSLHLLANPRVLLANGGNLDPHHITNAWGTILKYQPPFKPEMWTSSVMPPEVYSWFENMYSKAFERAGITTQSAFAQKADGIPSAKGQREISNLQANRLAPISVRYEKLYIEMAQRMIGCIAQMVKQDKDYSIVFQGTRNAERIRAADVIMDPNDYTVQVFATAFLSRTPGAAFEDIKDLMGVELVDKSEARALMNFPDLQRVFDLENASRDNFERIIELMLDKGIYLAPQPWDDLQLAKKVFREAYNRARVEEIEENRVELLRRYMEENQALIDTTEAEAAAKAAPPPMPAAMPSPMAPEQTQGMPV